VADARRPIRVLVVDDSAVMRKLLPIVLQHDPDVEVVATAVNGVVGLRKLAQFRPDVVTLDLEMPGMDGLEVLREIVTQDGTPVIVVSAHTAADAALTAAALSTGAVDVVAKPRSDQPGGLESLSRELRSKLYAVAGRRLRPLHAPPVSACAFAKAVPGIAATRVVAVAASTGGPAALAHLLSALPADLPAAVVVVQHMPEGFTEMLAVRLDQTCPLRVEEARDGDRLQHGRVLVARGGRHLRVRAAAGGPVVLFGGGPPVAGHRPSADVLFASVVAAFGPQCVGVVLTGMGEDGAAGLLAVRQARGFTIVQDEDSSVVFGMPRAAVARGAADQVLPLEGIAESIVAAVRRKAQREPAPAPVGLPTGPRGEEP
jgi:two-component system, chemotaxis family, protein-glutamate methylesterase/glutaminase